MIANDAAPAGITIDPDRPGELSIVLQGGLSPDNAVEIANNCRHWRDLFPHAQIILSLSGPSMLGAGRHGDRRDSAATVSPFGDPHTHAAATSIEASCDVVTAGGSGLPLPPIKSDTVRPNNVNLQIGAARNGLAHASGRYTLRIRSDAVFLDRTFLDQYADTAALPRSHAAVLRQRVMISWLYTLNPYTTERLPLHFSDWFHFGLTHDVASLWDVPEMTLADATYHRTHPHAPGSNPAERLFLTRLAVEQHLTLSALRRRFPELTLDFHNDQSSRTQALAILLDDFCLCDLEAAAFLLPRYQLEPANPLKLSHCLTPGDWRALLDHRSVDPAIILSGKIASANDPAAFERREGRPERYRLAQLPGGQALASAQARAGGAIHARRFSGVPAGAYTAWVRGTVASPGPITLAVRLAEDQSLLVERRVDLQREGNFVEVLDFDSDEAVAVDMLCMADDAAALAVARIGLRQRAKRHGRPALPLILPRHDGAAGDVHEADTAFAPFALPPGRYLLALDVAEWDRATEITLTTRRSTGEPVLPSDVVSLRRGSAAGFVVPFELARAERHGLTVSYAPADAPVKALVVAEAESDPLSAPFPRLIAGWRFTPQQARVDNGELVAVRPDGLVCFGPYMALPAGSYTAQVNCRDMKGVGRAEVRITSRAGTHRLAARTVDLGAQDDATIVVGFDVDATTSYDIEVLVSAHAVETITVSSVLVSQITVAERGRHEGARGTHGSKHAPRPIWRKRLRRFARQWRR